MYFRLSKQLHVYVHACLNVDLHNGMFYVLFTKAHGTRV